VPDNSLNPGAPYKRYLNQPGGVIGRFHPKQKRLTRKTPTILIDKHVTCAAKQHHTLPMYPADRLEYDLILGQPTAQALPFPERRCFFDVIRQNSTLPPNAEYSRGRQTVPAAVRVENHLVLGQRKGLNWIQGSLHSEQAFFADKALKVACAKRGVEQSEEEYLVGRVTRLPRTTCANLVIHPVQPAR